MQQLADLLEEFNSLRLQVYEAELTLQQYDIDIDQPIHPKQQQQQQSQQQQQQQQQQNNDQLNKITLALSNSLNRVIKDLYYDEDKENIVIKLLEQNIIIELEIRNQELKRIKLQQVGRRDYTLIDDEHQQIDETYIKLLQKYDQPFSQMIINFLQKLHLI